MFVTATVTVLPSAAIESYDQVVYPRPCPNQNAGARSARRHAG
ncbi:hypothetical protein [[Actinomadura] parvosata]